METDEMEQRLGEQVRNLRLRHDLQQQELARRAGTALNAVKNIENGRGATIGSLVRILRALGRADWIDTLAPAVSISPLQVLRSRAPRQRARGKTKSRGV